MIQKTTELKEAVEFPEVNARCQNCGTMNTFPEERQMKFCEHCGKVMFRDDI